MATVPPFRAPISAAACAAPQLPLKYRTLILIALAPPLCRVLGALDGTYGRSIYPAPCHTRTRITTCKPLTPLWVLSGVLVFLR